MFDLLIVIWYIGDFTFVETVAKTHKEMPMVPEETGHEKPLHKNEVAALVGGRNKLRELVQAAYQETVGREGFGPRTSVGTLLIELPGGGRVITRKVEGKRLFFAGGLQLPTIESSPSQ